MIRLGLCCIFRDEPIKFRTTTAAAVQKLRQHERLAKLSDICLSNAHALLEALQYCSGHGIGCFRINSQILPIKTHPEVGYDLGDLPGGEQIVDQFRRCGEFARANGLRITLHPDRFVVLNSPKPEVVEHSIAELAYQAEVAEWVGADVINIHAGGSWQRYVEFVALAACIVTVGCASFGRPVGGSTPPVMLYAPLPLLLRAGTRFGLAGVSWALLAVAFHAVWGALHGRGPFTSPDPAENILQLQLFLLSISLPLMVLAVITEEHRRAFSALAHQMAMHKQADERFRLVVESSPSAIVMIDAAGTIVLANAQTEKYFGYSRADLVGQPIEILVPERFRSKHHDDRALFSRPPCPGRSVRASSCSASTRTDASSRLRSALLRFRRAKGSFASVRSWTSRNRSEPKRPRRSCPMRRDCRYPEQDSNLQTSGDQRRPCCARCPVGARAGPLCQLAYLGIASLE